MRPRQLVVSVADAAPAPILRKFDDRQPGATTGAENDVRALSQLASLVGCADKFLTVEQ